MLDAAAPPINTVAPVWKAVPLIVTALPPEAGPEAGEIEVTAGGATNVNPEERLTVWLSGFVTVTVAAPAACTGVTAVNWVAETNTTPVAAVPPTVRVAPDWKFVPLIVMLVPPAEE